MVKHGMVFSVRTEAVVADSFELERAISAFSGLCFSRTRTRIEVFGPEVPDTLLALCSGTRC
jgi:hypothetical protein